MGMIRQETHLELDRRDMFSLCGDDPQLLNCISGELWITFDGCAEDVILNAGEKIELRGRSGVVVSALRPASLILSSSQAGRPVCLLEAGQYSWSSVRRLRWRFPALSSLPAVQLR